MIRTNRLFNISNYEKRQIRDHQKDLNEHEVRDFLDILLLASRDNPMIGYNTINKTIGTLYLGASDTTTNSLRWLMLNFAVRPEAQEKCRKEILASIEEFGDVLPEKCPLLQSFLLENLRCFPVGDSLPHRNEKDEIIDGYFVKKDSMIQASLTAVMHDPENFDDPLIFKPERFVKNGNFEGDVRVCVFSIGLRNCVGKQLAQDTYFRFASKILENFKISANEPSFEPEESVSGAILMPKKSKLIFKVFE